jgi:hypothetical protein
MVSWCHGAAINKTRVIQQFLEKNWGRVGSHSVFLVAEIAQKRSKMHFTMPIRLGFVYADISMNKVPFVVEFALNSSEMTLSFRFLGCFASDGDVPWALIVLEQWMALNSKTLDGIQNTRYTSSTWKPAKSATEPWTDLKRQINDAPL